MYVTGMGTGVQSSWTKESSCFNGKIEEGIEE
jgi:hypothetical protein